MVNRKAINLSNTGSSTQNRRDIDTTPAEVLKNQIYKQSSINNNSTTGFLQRTAAKQV